MSHKILQQKVYHNGTSMVVLQPGDKHDVPERFLQLFVDEGVIAKPKGNTSDGDGAPTDEFAMSYKPVGSYVITGPGLLAPEVVKGKEAADARFAELKQAHADAQGDGDGAPTE